MKHSYAVSSLFFLLAAVAQGQYCSPNFAFGCFSWHNQSIDIGSINWTPGADDCTVSDYTSLSTTVNAGDNVPMTVVNGVWSGCAVWVDLDNSSSFEDSENLYYVYVGGDPSYTYNFNITIPSGTPTGSYRMRVIGPWGSDGFSNTNTNGYGPCGDFQYGNFTDLTLNVVGSTGMVEANADQNLTISTDRSGSRVTISAGTAIGDMTIIDAQGRMVEQHRAVGDLYTLDTQAWVKGVYFVRVQNEGPAVVRRFVVD